MKLSVAMRPKYLKELDGLRGLAAIMVMYFHFFSRTHSGNSSINSLLTKTAVFGQTGVILFFVLSGFLITRILLSAKDQPRYFSNFYIRRSLRIFPLYYFALCIYLLFAGFLNEDANNVGGATWYYWPYIQNIAMTFKWNVGGPLHFWSLSVEEHFYLFWPLVIYYTSIRRLPFVIAFLVISTIVIRSILLVNTYEVFYFTGTTMDALAIGSLLAVTERNNCLKKYSRAFYLSAFSVVILTLGAIWLFVGGKGLLIIQALKGTVVAFFYYLVLLMILTSGKNSIAQKFLNQRWLAYTGKISYGLYVYHVLCFSIYFKYSKSSHLLVDLLICFILSYALSSLSYYFFEVRFLNLKDKLTSWNIGKKTNWSLQLQNR